MRKLKLCSGIYKQLKLLKIMKKLFLAVSLLAASFLGASAQTVWDFSTLTGMTTSGSTNNTYATQGVKSNLGYFINPNGTGTTYKTAFDCDFSSKSAFTSVQGTSSGPVYSGAYAGEKLNVRLKLGGKGASSTDANPNMPSSNFVYFKVTGNTNIAVFFRSSTSTPTDGRKLYITDGTNLLNSYQATNDAQNYITASYTGGSGTIYIYGLENAYNLYRIEATTNVGTTVEIPAGVKQVSADLLAKQGDALVNPTGLAVDIYSVMGAVVVKSSDALISLTSLPKGVYVAKTSEGILKFIK